MANEFAINGQENRISYLVGPGHSYRATICKGMHDSPDAALAAQKLLDRFQRENRWQERQQEIVRRMDRDGEAFLRFFVDPSGLTRVRFIEPDQISTPPLLATDPEMMRTIFEKSIPLTVGAAPLTRVNAPLYPNLNSLIRLGVKAP